MKTVFVCPLDLERLTGTPIRIKTTINAVSEFSETVTITAGGEKFGSFVSKTLRALHQSRPDVVHGFTTVSIIPMLCYKVFSDWRVKVIFEMHGWAWYETFGKLSLPKRLVFLGLDFIGLWFATRVIAVSRTEREFLKRKTPRSGCVITIWDPVDFLVDYVPLPARPFIKVGYIGNSERWQGLEYIIDAARKLEADPSIQFALAGFKSDDEVRFPKLKNIKYVGRVERADVPAFLVDCDILVSGRLREPVSDLQFPHKLSEYLAVARPVITSAASDQPFVVKEGDCGFVIDPLSGGAIARAINDFAVLPPAEKVRLSKNAHEFCKNNLYVGVFATKLKEIYDGL